MRSVGLGVLFLAGCGTPSLSPTSPILGMAPLLSRPTLASIPAQDFPEDVVRIPEDAKLSNGIQILVMPDPLFPGIRLELRLRVGSWNDPTEATGLAELTFQTWRSGGTEALPGSELDRELAFLGAELDVHVGAMTTQIGLSGLSTDFPRLLGILQDLVIRPRFLADRLELERGILLGELRVRDDNPSQVASREARRALYGRQDPRVRRPEFFELKALTLAQVEAFYAAQVGSRQAMISVLGDIQLDGIQPLLEEVFGDWEEQPVATQEFFTQAPRPQAVRVVLLPRPDASQTEIRILAGGVRRSHPDWPALRLGAAIFGSSGFSNRMVTRIRRELGLTYSVGADWIPGWTQEGLFFGWCGTEHSAAPQAVAEMLLILRTFLEDGVSDLELESARARLLHAEIFRTDTRAEALAMVADLDFHAYPRNSPEQELLALRSLTAKQVVAACRRHLDPEKMLVFLVGNADRFEGEMPAPLEIWEPNPKPAKPTDGQEEGALLVEHLLSGHGGIALWESLGEVQARLDSLGSNPAEAFAPSGLAFQEAARLPQVLVKLAGGGFRAQSPRPDTLVLTDSGGAILVLNLREDGLVTSLRSTLAVCRFSDYQLTGGVLLPARVEVTPQDSTSVEFSMQWILGSLPSQ